VYGRVRVWDAEIVVDEGLARRLLGSQLPELEVRSLHHLADGWDNTVWVANGELAFRFPRRAIAVPLLEREIELLPRLAPLLPLPIPVPTHIGRASDAFPWPFFGAQLVPGRELADVDVDPVKLGTQLGGFLRALHDVELDLALPVDPNNRADMSIRVPMARKELSELGALSDEVESVLDAALDLPKPEPTVVAHGDLHLRHALVGRDGGLSGVIDWGDACRADPSVDLSLYWSHLSDAGRAAFLAAYGTVTDEQFLRARLLALNLCAVIANYARHQRTKRLERASLDGLTRAVQ
jgi:aminoglycoside phosphotransferase (APT) family kinase protein